MLYREIIAVCSEIHTKHINTLWAERISASQGGLLLNRCNYASLLSSCCVCLVTRLLAGRSAVRFLVGSVAPSPRQSVHSSSAGHPASCSVVKLPGRVVDRFYPSNAILRMSGAMPVLPSIDPPGVNGDNLVLLSQGATDSLKQN
jgi:hypothetical protein